jgi:hypothetical protein
MPDLAPDLALAGARIGTPLKTGELNAVVVLVRGRVRGRRDASGLLDLA